MVNLYLGIRREKPLVGKVKSPRGASFENSAWLLVDKVRLAKD